MNVFAGFVLRAQAEEYGIGQVSYRSAAIVG